MPLNMNTIGSGVIINNTSNFSSIVKPDVEVSIENHYSGDFRFRDEFFKKDMFNSGTTHTIARSQYNPDPRYSKYPVYTFFIGNDEYALIESTSSTSGNYDFINLYTTANDTSGCSGLAKVSNGVTTFIPILSDKPYIWTHNSLMDGNSIIMVCCYPSGYVPDMNYMKILKYDGSTITILNDDCLTSIYNDALDHFNISKNYSADKFYGLEKIDRKYYAAFSLGNVGSNMYTERVMCELDASFKPKRWYRDVPIVDVKQDVTNDISIMGSCRWNTFVGKYMYSRIHSIEKNPNTDEDKRLGLWESFKILKYRLEISSSAITLTYMGTSFDIPRLYSVSDHYIGQFPCNSLCSDNHAIIGAILYDRYDTSYTKTKIAFHKNIFEAYIDPTNGSLVEHKLIANPTTLELYPDFVEVGITDKTIGADLFYESVAFHVNRESNTTSSFSFCYGTFCETFKKTPFNDWITIGSNIPYVVVTYIGYKGDTIYSNGNIVSITNISTNSTISINKKKYTLTATSTFKIIIESVNSLLPIVYITDTNGFILHHNFEKSSTDTFIGPVLKGMIVNNTKVTEDNYSKSFTIKSGERFYIDMKGV